MIRLLIVTFIIGILCIGSGYAGFAQSEPAEGEVIKGTVICLGCTLKKEEGAKAQCSIYGHKHALRTADGKIWSFLENDASSELISNHDYNGKRVEVIGRKFGDANVIEVENFRILSEEAGMAPEAATHMPHEGHSHMAPEEHSY